MAHPPKIAAGGAASLREQFNFFADSKVMFYIGHTQREQLEWIVANHKPGESFKVDELMKMEFKENIDLRSPKN